MLDELIGKAKYVLGSALLMYSCGGDVQESCVKDTDCKEDRLCIDGYCQGEDVSGSVGGSTSPQGDILFVREFADNGLENKDVFLIDSKSTGERRLTSDLQDDHSPVWSTDKKMVAYQSAGVKVMNSDGSEAQLLDSMGSLPLWAPDSKVIAYSVTRGQGEQIYLINSDGSNKKKLSDDEVARGMRWSPDGKTIAYIRGNNVTHGSGWGLATINVASGNITDLTNEQGQPRSLSWDNTGQFLTYALWERGPPQMSYLKKVELGSRIVETIQAIELDFQQVYHGFLNPQWSPDGSKIGFASDMEGEQQIYSINPDGGGLANLTPDDNTSEFSWSPQGDKLAYSCQGVGETTDICIMDADGANKKNLTKNPLSDTDPQW
jgi:Tol biopolymer transport system component